MFVVFQNTKTPGLRPMTIEDIEGLRRLLQANLGKFHLKAGWSREEVAHWLLPREDVIDTYVVEVRRRHRLQVFVTAIKRRPRSPS